MTDPRKAKTLGEACMNPDGTYNAWKLGAWLISATTGNKEGPTPDELKAEFERRKAEKRK